MDESSYSISAEGRVRRMRLIDADRLIELMNERDAVCSEPKNAVDIGYSLAVKHMKYEIEQNNEYHCKIYDVDIKQFECKKPKTNADRIRSMSDEELLDFICSIETYDDGSVKTIEGGCALCSVTDVENWLQSEVEE